jgi:hypothetical protein
VKKKILKLVLATSVLTAVVSVGTVSAATTAQTFVTASLSFNGSNADLRTVEVNKVKLVALRDLTDALGASLESDNGTITLRLQNTVELKEKTTTYTVNGATMVYTTAPVNVGGTLFVELDTTVDGLGGSIEANASGATSYRSFKLLEGDFSTPYWISGNKIIAVKDGDTKSIYKVNPADSSYELYSDNEDALSMVVSPDGNYGVYTNTDAQLKLIKLNPGVITTLSSDKTLKTDLTWSADSKKIYFAQGDNQEKLSYIDVATGVITKVSSDDTVQFKSDLHLSADGTKLLYNLNVTGTADVKAPTSADDLAASEDSLTVDFSKAGAQLLMLDLATAAAKPVKLTDGKSNTYDSTVLNDGSAVYVNVDPADEASKGSLKLVSPAGVIKDLVTDLDVTSSVATASGSFIITGLNAAGKTVVATVTADGKKTDLVTSDADVEGISSSTDGSSIFATIGGKLVVIKNGSISYLTK